MKQAILLIWAVLTLGILLSSCSASTEESPPADGDSDSDGDQIEDLDGDEDGDGDGEGGSEDEIEDKEEEVEGEQVQIPPLHLPFTFERSDDGEPIPATELTAFSERLAALLKDIRWFDYILRHSHGVDASTGKPAYVQWWGDVDAIKEGDTVTFQHRWSEEHGGHNVGTSFYKILASAVAASLLSNDPTINQLVSLACGGVAASMKGMVFDENDPLPYLMTRNVITFNHAYTTHDGRKKAVEYDNWYHSYSRWNCERFEYPNNPYWGSVWVTNVRSKDDVGGLMRNTAMIEMAARRSKDAGVREACGETLELLHGFAGDIVDHGYYIRTKDENGEPFIFSNREKPEGIRISKDLDNFVTFDPVMADSECNAKRASDWIGKANGTLTDCGNGAETDFEWISLFNNYPNVNFYRNYHMANAYQSLLHGDLESARLLLEGMVQRFEGHMDPDLEGISVDPDRWHVDLAPHLLRAAAQGYPLTSREIRMIHKYTERAMDFYETWEYWDLWSEDVPDGTYGTKPPNNDGGEGADRLYWMRIEDMSAMIEYCWSPYKNPDGRQPVDCSIMGDPEKWL